MSPRALRAAAVIALLSPGTAWACAVCAGGNPANRFAFFASTIALSVLPLGMFAGAFLWLRSRWGRGSDEFKDRDHVTPGVMPRLRKMDPGSDRDPGAPPPPAG